MTRFLGVSVSFKPHIVCKNTDKGKKYFLLANFLNFSGSHKYLRNGKDILELIYVILGKFFISVYANTFQATS